MNDGALTPQQATEFQARANEAYDLVRQKANYFMHTCKNFHIEILQLEDPSYLQMAENLRVAAGLIGVLADHFDPMMGTKAVQYCELMVGMGVAIENSNEVELSRLVHEMEKLPGT